MEYQLTEIILLISWLKKSTENCPLSSLEIKKILIPPENMYLLPSKVQTKSFNKVFLKFKKIV